MTAISSIIPEPYRTDLLHAAQVGTPGSPERIAAVKVAEARVRRAIPEMFIHEIRNKAGNIVGYEPPEYAELVAKWNREHLEREREREAVDA